MNEDWKTWKFAGIYQLYNIVNDKMYIGQSQNIATRIGYYSRGQSKACKLIYRAIKHYKWNVFLVILLERVDDLSKLTEREQYWMDFYDATNHKKGYNMCPAAGSTSGYKYTEEAKVNKRGHPRPEGAGIPSKPVCELDKETGIKIKVWESIGEAARKTMASPSSIRMCCNNSRLTAGSRRWCWSNDYTSTTKSYDELVKERNTKLLVIHKIVGVANLAIPVDELDKNTGELIKSWNSKREAARKTKANVVGISACCNTGYGTSGNRKWRFTDPALRPIWTNLDNFFHHKKRVSVSSKLVCELDKETGFLIKIWPSLHEAHRETKIGVDGIRDCCNDAQITAGGHRWCWSKNYTGVLQSYCEFVRIHKAKLPIRHKVDGSGTLPISVDELDQHTNELIRSWSSQSEAARVLKISSSGISRCCTTGKGTAGGYKWRFTDLDYLIKEPVLQ